MGLGHFVMNLFKIAIGIVIVILIIAVIWYIVDWLFFSDDFTNKEGFISYYNDGERIIKPWYWGYDPAYDDLYYTPTYAYPFIYYDSRPYWNRYIYRRRYVPRHYSYGHYRTRSHHGGIYGGSHGGSHGGGYRRRV